MTGGSRVPIARRDFLQRSAGTLAGLALGATPGSLSAWQGSPRHPSAARSLDLLLLGGTGFLGPHQIRYALQRGHRVSIFNRGRTEPRMFPELFREVEHLQGDRGGDLAPLRGRSWDAVLDNSGQNVQWARDSAEALADSVQRYLFVSSTGVYFPYLSVGITEEVQPRLEDDPPRDALSYGVMKARSELEIRSVFGDDRSTIVRPNYIVGPGDTTDRFPYWPVRIAQGGDVLVPGSRDDPVQFQDVRDLTEWMIHLVEEDVGGTFNSAGPFPTQATISEMVHGIRAVTTESVEWVWIDDYDFLSEAGVRYMVPWVMPRGNSLGHTRINYDRAVAHGLRHRPLAGTVEDTLAWWASDAVPPERRARPGFVLDIEREAQIIARWRARGEGP